jgi:sulfonate transport system substrate-binding protein
MKQKIVVNVGGVPEHFNYPWHFAQQTGMFKGLPFDLVWHNEPAGTGALCEQLENGTFQLAVVLTEGIVRHIAKGAQAKIIGSFVASPLIWGIHVPIDAAFDQPSEMQGKRYAISRKGSGSHLMAFVDAKNRGQQIEAEQLVITGGLEGTRQAFKEKRADILLWEKFITSPLVRAKEFKCIGECITPWPCFVLAINDSFEKEHDDWAELIIDTMNAACRLFMNLPDAAQIISDFYQLHPDDAKNWFYQTEWQCEMQMSKKALTNALFSLKEVGLIEGEFHPEKMIARRTILK